MNIASFLSAAAEITEITPTRNLNVLYIVLDSVFIVLFMGLLIWKKRYQTAVFALAGGILYTIVDFGGFYLMSHTRTVMINGEIADMGHTFAVLLWMSMSYGITNFAFMWVLMAKDKLAKYWIFLIVVWWLIAPSISELGGAPTIQTSRTTGAYHGWMGVVMVVDYIILAILLMRKEPKPFVSIIRLFFIGFFVQFGWEFALLINGIRPLNGMSIQTLLVNSCLETNLGMPTTFLVFYLMRKFRNEDFTKPDKTVSIEPEQNIGFIDRVKALFGIGKKTDPTASENVSGAESAKPTEASVAQCGSVDEANNSIDMSETDVKSTDA